MSAPLPDAPPNLSALLDEALTLRVGLILPMLEDGPVEMIDRLRLVRTRLDRADVLLAHMIRFRTRVKIAHRDAAAVAEDRWAEKVVPAHGRRSSASDGWGGSAPRERYAEADLATLVERRAARQYESLLDQVNGAVELMRQVHRGLDTFRQDLHLILRAINVEIALER